MLSVGIMPLTAAGLSENFARFPINLAAENLMRGQRYKKKLFRLLVIEKSAKFAIIGIYTP